MYDLSIVGVLYQLKFFGVSLLVDDFGIGNVNFVYFVNFLFDGFKIDCFFIQKIG